jgi:hypothetical protein
MSLSKPQEILGLSDEDFAKMSPPDVDPNDRSVVKDEPEESEEDSSGSGSSDDNADAADDADAEKSSDDSGEDTPEGAEADPEDQGSSEDGEASKGKDSADGAVNAGEDKPVSADAKPKEKAKADPKADEQKAKEEPKAQEGEQVAHSPEVMAQFYEKVVKTPLKANGKLIQINTPEEAIGLMQMGANYTRKMQELAPFRKAMTMLSKHNLLNEDELSFLIDIRNKNPDAIKKLVKDAGIDPMDIGEDAGKEYRLGNHRVSDNEVKFREGMDSLKATPEGQATLSEIHTNWDDASKDLLWDHPQILSDIHTHRENGFYAKVSDEVARQKALGKIPADTPFLYAYKHVGDQLVAQSTQGGSPARIQPQATVDSTKTPVVTARAPTTKPVVKNGDKAAAAATTKSTTKVASRPVNPLAMPDDEFMKQFENRL